MIDLWLESALLHNEAVFEFSRGVTVIVGPNNAGKSQFLRDVYSALARPAYEDTSPQSFRRLQIGSATPRDLARQHLSEQLEARDNGVGGVVFSWSNGAIQEGSALQVWEHMRSFAELQQLLVQLLSADARLSLVQSQPSFDTTGLPASPLQRLYVDRALETRVSKEAEAAFGTPLTLHRYRGSIISLHVGRPTRPETVPPEPSEYLHELNSLPEVSAQGDGIRSYVGMILSIAAGTQQLVLLDEPEAFLHPPQARAFGRFLATVASEGMQVVVATHSSDLIQGLTSVPRPPELLSIARLTRKDRETPDLASIPPESLRKLYRDPLLKFTGTLDGLFYHGACVCEAEGDCTYYSATLESDRVTAPDEPWLRRDIHFTHTNGKDRIAAAVAAIRSAGVPVASILDIDVLRDETTFNAIVLAHGGSVEALSGRRNDVVGYADSLSHGAVRSEALTAIGPILSAAGPRELTPDESRQVAMAARPSSGWRELKRAGRSLMRGGVLASFDSLVADLSQIGMFILASGELESLHPEVSARNKSDWLGQVLESEAFRAPGDQHLLVSNLTKFVDQSQ